jgi:ATP-binding cassette subfamily B protein
MISTKFSHTVAYNILYELRIKLAKKLTRLPFGYFNNNNVGAIKKIFSENIEKLEAFIAHNIPELMGALIAFLTNTIFLFYMDWRMALAAISIIPLMFISQIAMYKGIDKLMEQYNTALINMNDSIIEYTNGMEVIKAFNQTTSSFSKYKNSIEYYADFEKKWGRRTLKGFSLFTTFMESGIITILPVGVVLYLKGSLSMAMLIFFLIMGMGYTKPLNKVMVLGDEFSIILKGEEELNKVFQLKELELRDEK